MNKYVFLAKIKNSDDRDCVYYYELDSFTFECSHYFSGLRLSGACFSGFVQELKDIVNNDFDNLETILTKEDFNKLFDIDKKIHNLGYGISYGDNRYNLGYKLANEVNYIVKKLQGSSNELLFDKVITDEKEWVKKEYNLTDDEVNVMFDNYGKGYSDLGYRDRSIGTIYTDKKEFIDDLKWNMGYDEVPYFDDEMFYQDMIENNSYLELESGKIVSYNY